MNIDSYKNKITKIKGQSVIYQDDNFKKLLFEFLEDCRYLCPSDASDVIEVSEMLSNLKTAVDEKSKDYLRRYLG